MWTTMPTSEPDTLAGMSDLNERVRAAAAQAQVLMLDVCGATLESIAACQEQAATEIDVEWISTVLDAQAKFTRELARFSATGFREFRP